MATELGLKPPMGISLNLTNVKAMLHSYSIPMEAVSAIEQRIALLPHEQPTLADLMHDLWNHEAWREPEQQDGIYVGTIHSFKGREAAIVFLPAFEQGIIPSHKKDSNLGEERRLAFVAITRAESQLHVSYARKRPGFGGQILDCEPSQFIAEGGIQ